MWPFTPRTNNRPQPSIRFDGLIANWNAEFNQWEFSHDGVDYSLADNPVFDSAIPSRLVKIAEWLHKLDSDIDEILKQHLEHWATWNRKKEIVTIDVSHLVDRDEVDVAFASDEWADLGINVIIQSGKIIGSYAGD